MNKEIKLVNETSHNVRSTVSAAVLVTPITGYAEVETPRGSSIDCEVKLKAPVQSRKLCFEHFVSDRILSSAKHRYRGCS